MQELIDLKVRVAQLEKIVELMEQRLVMAEEFLKASVEPKDCFEEGS